MPDLLTALVFVCGALILTYVPVGALAVWASRGGPLP